MSSIASSTDAPLHPRPRLRLAPDAEARHADLGRREEELTPAQTELGGRMAHVLVAGADTSSRLRMLGELRNLLPASTRFLEAHETWEVLALAAGSRMVVLTGDLGDISTESLVRLLGRRHPTLPVLAVDSRARAGAPADVDAATV
jgi:hypothetical protein